MPFFDNSKAPPCWTIAPDGPDNDAMLVIGERAVALADIADWHTTAVAESNSEGHLLAVGGFMLVSAMLALAVSMSLIGIHFLAGALLFGGIGFTVLLDLKASSKVVLHRVTVLLRDGRSETFATASQFEVEALTAALADALGLGARAA